MSTATFAAGCFWGVEAAFRQVEGVRSTSVGYTGGATQDPSYEQVCSGNTGHAEAVEVVFDPDRVSYDDLLQVFWENHDPTTLNSQGHDRGSQYRSAIFFQDAEQQAVAAASLKAAQSNQERPIVTEITGGTKFYPAEDYHQQYLEKRGLAQCRIK
ncbi:MAG: peptide-methionine (S)-S-oxide reductase [Acidobacteria bacterium]|nr:MAG: peptide-methionine (S)-S-oxide reductase [Acidobacteriota bacterium]